MILLWGPGTDSPLLAVARALEHRGAAWTIVEQRSVLQTDVHLTVGCGIRGWVRCGDERTDLAAVTAAYLRPHDTRRVPAVARAGEGSAVWRHALGVEDALLSWADIAPARVVNRPAAMAGNNAKPAQIAQLRSLGFAVPDTLVTTEPAAAEAFWEEHRDVIYKSVSGVRSIVARLTDEHRARLADVRWCPTQFQAYSPGTDHRIHVVGEEVFGCEIRSDADDYRYAGRLGGSADIRACAVDSDLAERCRGAARAMGLAVAGFDLRRTPDGAWVAFEANPSPGFTYYEAATGLPIAGAIARLLAQPPGC